MKRPVAGRSPAHRLRVKDADPMDAELQEPDEKWESEYKAVRA